MEQDNTSKKGKRRGRGAAKKANKKTGRCVDTSGGIDVSK